MYNGKKIIVVMPAYNASKTLKLTYEVAIAVTIINRKTVLYSALNWKRKAMNGGGY